MTERDEAYTVEMGDPIVGYNHEHLRVAHVFDDESEGVVRLSLCQHVGDEHDPESDIDFATAFVSPEEVPELARQLLNAMLSVFQRLTDLPDPSDASEEEG